MAFQRRKAAPAVLHVGVDRYGSLVRSESPIDNQATRFLRYLVSEVRNKLLSPADVVTLVGAQSEALHALFSLSTISAWSVQGRFWRWPLARCSRASEEMVRFMGEARPIWLSDPNRWDRLCEQSEKAWRTECRYEHVRPTQVFGHEITLPQDLVFHCSVHGEIRP